MRLTQSLKVTLKHIQRTVYIILQMIRLLKQ